MAKETKKEDSNLVRILSKRLGDVVCPDGTLVKAQQVALVKPEMAEWLIKSFGSLMLKIEV